MALVVLATVIFMPWGNIESGLVATCNSSGHARNVALKSNVFYQPAHHASWQSEQLALQS